MDNSEVITVTVQPVMPPLVVVMNTPDSIPVDLVPVLTPASEQSDFNFLVQYLLTRG